MIPLQNLAVLLVLLISLASEARASAPMFVGKREASESEERANNPLPPSEPSKDMVGDATQFAKRAAAIDSEELEAAPYFEEKRQAPMFVGRRQAPMFVGRRQAPMFVGRRQAPMFVGRRQAPMFVGRRQAPMFVGRRQAPMFVGKRQAPMFVGKRSAEMVDSEHHIAKRAVPIELEERPSPYFVGRRDAPLFVGRRRAPMFVGKRKAPMFVGKRKAPMFVGKRRAPMFVGKRRVPMFVGKRKAPMFVGKRRAPMFVGKRDAIDPELVEQFRQALLEAFAERLREQIMNEKRLYGAGLVPGKRSFEDDESTEEWNDKRAEELDFDEIQRLAQEYRQKAIDNMREMIQNDRKRHGPGWVGKRDGELAESSYEYAEPDLEDLLR